MTQSYLYWSRRTKKDNNYDWKNSSKNWIDGYWKSVNHPHRKLIINAIFESLPIHSILELGCNCGPNLQLIQTSFPSSNIQLAGIDVNKEAIEFGKEKMTNVNLQLGRIDEPLPFDSYSFDMIIADAALMYVSPKLINSVMDEINRIVKKTIIIIDWMSESETGIIINHHWARNYVKLLENKYFIVTAQKIQSHQWPNKNWINNGYFIVGKKKFDPKQLLTIFKEQKSHPDMVASLH